MSFNRTRNSIRNISVSIICKVIGLLAPFILRTLIIQKLGAEYLGLNSLFTSVLQMLCLTELGFGSAMTYSMYKPIAEGNEEQVCKLLYYYKKVYFFVGIIVFVLGLTIVPFIRCLISSDIPSDVNIYLAYFIFLINTVTSYFLFAYKSSILNVCLRNDVDTLIITICNILMYSIQACVLVLFGNYYIYIIVMPIMTVIINLTRLIITNKMFPQYRPISGLDKESMKDIMVRVKGLIGHKLGGVVFSSVDSAVISAFLGLIVLGRYTNYFYIYTALTGFMMIVFQSITAIIGNSIASESVEHNYKVFRLILFLNNCITGWSSICLMCLYQPFMELWMGIENLLPISLVALLVIYYYVVNIRRVCITYKDAAGMWSDDFWKPYVSVLVNLVFNILLVSIIGLPGVVISSIMAVAMVEIPWETKVLFRKYFSIKEFEYYTELIKFSGVTFIAGAISYVLCSVLNNTWFLLPVRGVICTIVSIFTYFVVYRKNNEFIQLFLRIKRGLFK